MSAATPIDYKGRAEYWEREAATIRAGANQLRERRAEQGDISAEAASWLEDTILASEANADAAMRSARTERRAWVAQVGTETAALMRRCANLSREERDNGLWQVQIEAAAARLEEAIGWTLANV